MNRFDQVLHTPVDGAQTSTKCSLARALVLLCVRCATMYLSANPTKLLENRYARERHKQCEREHRGASEETLSKRRSWLSPRLAWLSGQHADRLVCVVQFTRHRPLYFSCNSSLFFQPTPFIEQVPSCSVWRRELVCAQEPKKVYSFFSPLLKHTKKICLSIFALES